MYVYIQLYAFSIQNTHTHTHARPPVSCHAPSRLVPTFPLSISISLSQRRQLLFSSAFGCTLYIHTIYCVCTYTCTYAIVHNFYN